MMDFIVSFLYFVLILMNGGDALLAPPISSTEGNFVDIFPDISSTEATEPESYIWCGESTTGMTTNHDISHYYSFSLYKDSYVTISTCGSNFDTYLYLYDSNGIEIYKNDDDAICGVNAVIETELLSAGDYVIHLTGFGATFGEYDLAVQCGQGGSPSSTTPGGNGIPIESDCNLVSIASLSYPIDVCSMSVTFMDDGPGQSNFYSRMYTCNANGDGVLLINYQTADCLGQGQVATDILLFEEASTYYYNCDAPGNCAVASVSVTCVHGNSPDTFQTLQFVQDECVNGKQMECIANQLAFVTYLDEDCDIISNISYAVNDDVCTVSTQCAEIGLTSTPVPVCEGGCDLGFECDYDSGECVRDCDIFAIDEYLVGCSAEFSQQASVVKNLETEISNLQRELIAVNARIDAFAPKKDQSQSGPVAVLPTSDGLKDMLLIILFIINIMVVIYLCYEKGVNKNKEYVNVESIYDEDEQLVK